MRGTSTIVSKETVRFRDHQLSAVSVMSVFAVTCSYSDVVCSGAQLCDVVSIYSSVVVWFFGLVIFRNYRVVATRPCAPPLFITQSIA